MLQPGDLVFAKVKGWWPWPARLMCQVSPKQYKVFFYGTRQESSVPVDCIWPVQDKLDSFTRKYGGHQDYVLALQEMKIYPDIFTVHDDDLCGHKCMTCDSKRRQQLKVGSNSQSNNDRDMNGSAEKSTKSINQLVKMSSSKRTSEVWLVSKFSGGNVISEKRIKTGMGSTKENISNKSTDNVGFNVSSHNIDFDSDNQKAVSKTKPPQLAEKSRPNSPNPEVKSNEKESMKRKMKMLSKMAKQRKLDGTHSIITEIDLPVRKNRLEVKTKPDTDRTTDKVEVYKKKLDKIVTTECNVTQKFNQSKYMEREPSKKSDKTCSPNQFGIYRNETSQVSIFKQIEHPGRETDKFSISEIGKPKINLARIEGCAVVGTVTKCKSKLGLDLTSKKYNATRRLTDLLGSDIRNSPKKSDETGLSSSDMADKRLFETNMRSPKRKSHENKHFKSNLGRSHKKSESDKCDKISFEQDIRSCPRKSDKTDNCKIGREDENLFKKDIHSSPKEYHETGHSKCDREDKTIFEKNIRSFIKKSDETDLLNSDRDDGILFKMDVKNSPTKYYKTDNSENAREDENSFAGVIRSSSKIGLSKTERKEAKQGNSSEFETKFLGNNLDNCSEAENSNYDDKKSNNVIENKKIDSPRNGDNFIGSFCRDIHEIINAEEEEDALEMEVSYGLLETSNESEVEDEGVTEENILERDLALTDDSSEEDTNSLSPI